jgi:5-methylcytosine-specific restriction endonuclease McrA
MDRDQLKRYLAEGFSLEQIGALLNRDPSTVGYWARKFDLRANGAEKYAPRGGLSADELQALVDEQLSLSQMAERLNRSVATVRYWLKKHGIEAYAAYRKRQRRLLDADVSGVREVWMRCPHHGPTLFRLDTRGSWCCKRCRAEAVSARRRRVKQILVAEAGGHCAVCGYDRYHGALQFHHLDPTQKSFHIARGGITRAVAKSREEAKKCVLLCANCHAEVEGGIASLPIK